MIKTFPCGLLDTNTYVVWEEHSLDAMIIDCGVEPQIISNFVCEMGLNIKYVVLTHGHFDHAHYVEEYEKAFPVSMIVCHIDEKAVLFDPLANLSTHLGEPKEYHCNYTFVKEGDLLTLGEKCSGECMNFQVLSTPGHTPGCICLYDEKSKIMFTGDTLFKRSYGRTDFKYGDPQKMYESLRRLYKMDREIAFYPGHYQSSTIENELSRK